MGMKYAGKSLGRSAMAGKIMKRLHALTAEDRLVISSMVLTMGGVILGAWLAEPRTFGITALAVISLLLGGWRVTQSRRLAWLLLFGLITGVLELWADWLHVVYFRSLVYTDDFGFRLLASPSYMPIGWWLTVVQFGYVGLRLLERWPPWMAVGLVSVLGMVLPPWYEEFAAPARAWHYMPSRLMLSHVPVWVIGAYGGCMFTIATMAWVFYRPQAWGRAVLGGIFTGAGLMFWGAFWFAWLGNR